MYLLCICTSELAGKIPKHVLTCLIIGIARWQVDCAWCEVIFLFLLFTTSKSSYDLYSSYHENGSAFIWPVLSLPKLPPAPCSCSELFEDGQPVVFYDECQQCPGAL